jgi:hypothetical protein
MTNDHRPYDTHWHTDITALRRYDVNTSDPWAWHQPVKLYSVIDPQGPT